MRLVTDSNARDEATIDVLVDSETGALRLEAYSDCHGCDFTIELSTEEREVLIDFLMKGKAT